MMTNEHTYNSDDEAKNYDPVDNYGASSDEEHNHPPSKTNNHTTASYGYSDYEDYSDHEDQHNTQARNSFLKQAVSHPSDLVSDLPTSPISSRGARVGVRDSYASHTSSHSHRYNTNGSQPAPLHNDDVDHAHIDDYPSSISPRPDTKANSAQQSRRNSWEEDDSEEEPYQAYDYGRDDDSEEEEEEEEEKPHVHNHDQQEQEDKGVEGYYDYSDDEKEEPHHPVHRDSHHEESQQHHQHSPRSSTDSRHSRHHDDDHHQVERKSFDEGEPAVSNPNMFQEASENIRASIASAKSYASSHAKHHSFGYDDRPAGYGERSESDSESSTSDPEESPFVDASATTITAAATAISVSAAAAAATATASAISATSPPPIPSKSRPTSSSSFSIAAVSARSSVQSRYRPTSITLSETREFKEETKQEEKEEVKVVESIVETVTAAPIPEPPVVGSSSPTSPVSKSSPLIVDTVSQKSVSTASSIDRREKRYSGSESDTSDTSIDLHSPTFKDPVRKATPPTIFNRAMSSTSITRDSTNNRGSSVEKARPISYATVFSDAEMNDVNLVDEPLNDKRASEIVPPTPSTPSAFGFASSFFGSRNSQPPPPPPPKPVAEVAAVASPATPVPATLAAAPVVASPVETRSRSASISALASSISGAFSRGFSTQSQPPVPPLPKTPTGINSQRASNVSPAPTSSGGIAGYFSSNSNRAGSMSDRASITSNQTTDSNMDLLLARLEAQNELLAQDSKRRATTDSEMDRALGHAKEESAGEDYDWDYWGALMHDYNAVVKRNPRQLTTMIQRGVPPALRGLIWQLLAKSKDQNLEGTFAELLKSTSSHEKQITRDMSRTFPNHEHFQAGGAGQEALFDVVKAYSLYDPEVGYCQGLSFVVGPLLLN
ncbi:GTPase-activating protein, partial [Haplosporangium sp. Z 27]